MAKDIEPQPSPHAKWKREAYLVDALRQLEQLVIDATAAKSWTAAGRAKEKAIGVRAELDQLRETRAREELPPDAEEHRQELLREIRRMRLGAQEAGSYVAAAKLIEQEQSFLLALEEERRRNEAERLAGAKPEEIVDELVQLIGTLPDKLLDQVREAIAKRGT